jgi:hypothetical protein
MRGIFRFGKTLKVTPWVEVDAPTIYGTSSNPTKPTTTIYDKLYWRRVGSFMEIRYHFEATDATGAAAGSGTYYWDIPDGQALDTNFMDLPGAVAELLKVFSTSVGVACGEGDGASTAGKCVGKAFMLDADTWGIALGSNQFEEIKAVSSSAYELNTAPIRYQALLWIPISGWGEF